MDNLIFLICYDDDYYYYQLLCNCGYYRFEDSLPGQFEEGSLKKDT